MPQYIGDSKRKVVHNPENAMMECQISQIASEDKVIFDSLDKAIEAGFAACKWCIGFETPFIEPDEHEEEEHEEEAPSEEEYQPSEGPIEPDP